MHWQSNSRASVDRLGEERSHRKARNGLCASDVHRFWRGAWYCEI